MTRGVPAILGPRVTFALPRGAALAYRDSLGSTSEQLSNHALVLLHGLGITADLNWGAAYTELCRRFHVVAPDLPGHGRGVRPWPKFSLEKCADHIVALADSLEIDRFIACGYSMGSLVAQLIWRRHPDRVSGLVLGAASRNFLGSPAERLVSSLSPALAVAARTNPLLRTLGADVFGTGYLNDIDDEGRRYLHAEMSLTSMSTVTAALVAVADFSSHTWIGDVDVPVSVLVTTRDSVVPPGRQMKLADAIPHATVVTIEGDHGVFVESPTQFTRKILEACQAAIAGPPASRRAFPWRRS
jgi:3-oxoadipate enol-lactonase